MGQIKRLRETTDLSMVEIAGACGVSVATAYRLSRVNQSKPAG